jgi:hypothetical protein
MDGQNNVYLFNSSDNSLTKTNLDLSRKPAISYEAAESGIQFSQGINDWVYDGSNHFIYAISSSANSILYINADTMQVVGDKFIGSSPADIELYHNQIYVSLSEATKVACTGTAPDSPVNHTQHPA